ncbi:hypothetical protein BD413DRAFT_30521 [Trametes elegans]|nr:hypothetical protein BD413DRAFT_30521 [Trametes elegans]
MPVYPASLLFAQDHLRPPTACSHHGHRGPYGSVRLRALTPRTFWRPGLPIGIAKLLLKHHFLVARRCLGDFPFARSTLLCRRSVSRSRRADSGQAVYVHARPSVHLSAHRHLQSRVLKPQRMRHDILRFSDGCAGLGRVREGEASDRVGPRFLSATRTESGDLPRVQKQGGIPVMTG